MGQRASCSTSAASFSATTLNAQTGARRSVPSLAAMRLRPRRFTSPASCCMDSRVMTRPSLRTREDSAAATATKILTFLLGGFYNVTDADLILFERAVRHTFGAFCLHPLLQLQPGASRGEQQRGGS